MRDTDGIRPVCLICGNEIKDDHCYEFGGSAWCYCDKCVDKELKKITPLFREELQNILDDSRTATPVVW